MRMIFLLSSFQGCRHEDSLPGIVLMSWSGHRNEVLECDSNGVKKISPVLYCVKPGIVGISDLALGVSLKIGHTCP